jgi:hypothetical protein
MKDYFKCHGCGMWGDEFQLLRDLRDIAGLPGTEGNYDTHRELLDHWREEYERLTADSTSTEEENLSDGAAPSSPPLTLSPRRAEDGLLADADWVGVDIDWADMREAERLELAGRVEELESQVVECQSRLAEAKHRLALAKYSRAFLEFVRRTEEHHMSECDDPECDAVGCRRARGWSEEQIRAGIRKIRRQARERLRRRRR